MKLDSLPKFQPKEEYTKIEFDPNVRHRLPTIPYYVMYKYLKNREPTLDPQSTYVAVNHKGKTYHLFNAKRFPIGRIATMASVFIRGKHRPGYNPMEYTNGDKVIVVNMKDPLLTGKKRLQKIYRHHTGYPGGLVEKSFKEVIQREPERVLTQALLGMLPKNKLRKEIIKRNLVMIRDQYHDYDFLPQFKDPIPEDLNDLMGLKSFTKDNTKITMIENEDGSVPEEFKDFPVEIDEDFTIPMGMREKKFTDPRKNMWLGLNIRGKDPKAKRYKVFKPKNVKYNFK